MSIAWRHNCPYRIEHEHLRKFAPLAKFCPMCGGALTDESKSTPERDSKK